MSRTISFVKGRGIINHNNRTFTAENVDATRTPLNITYVKIPIEQAYEEIFGDAVAEYNAKQKRNDRKIDNYMAKVKESKNNEKVFYETLVQIGRMSDTAVLDEDGNITDEALLAKKVLDEYARTFQERNPNLILFNAVLHMDEATPHLHLDYIPVAHGYKTGLSTRNSLTKGLQEMGIAKAVSKNDTETMHWQQREREYIADLCRARGLETEVLGIKRDDYSIPEYKKAMREKEAAEAEIEILRSEKEAAETLLETSLDQIGSNIEEIDEQKETLKEIENQIKEAEENRTRIMSDMSRMVKAGEKAEEEAAKIERSAKEVKSLLDKEPMVKIPRTTFDELVLTYRVTEATDILYRDCSARLREQQGLIKELRNEIAGLKNKIRQLTDFIESKGLLQAFKEFLKPKSVIKTLSEKKKIVIEREAQKPQLVPPKKKNKGYLR